MSDVVRWILSLLGIAPHDHGEPREHGDRVARAAAAQAALIVASQAAAPRRRESTTTHPPRTTAQPAQW